MFHVTIRVPWHQNRWNGTVCAAPSGNPYCLVLKRIREERDDAREDGLQGRPWSELGPGELPPCKAESAAFMNDKEWKRTFEHVYQHNKNAAATHGHLKPTTISVPPYTTFAVPFAWMLASEQRKIDESLSEPLAPDAHAPFPSAWVFGRDRQEALSNLFFGKLTPKRSLVFFYTKEGHPLGDGIARLVVGVGHILSIGPLQYYDTSGPTTYPFWDRLIHHSIRLDRDDGFLLPYHDYLTPTGDPDEDARRQELLASISVAVDSAHIRTFSYAAEHASSDVALSTLVRCLEAVRLIRQHGIAPGPWERREAWLNEQIAATWKDRGAFPGLGSVLEALKLRMGTALTLDLVQAGMMNPDDDPWPVIDALFRGTLALPKPVYAADVEAVRPVWLNLSEERRALLKLLSRFSLSPKQASRWFNATERAEATSSPVTDAELLANPYRIVELDLGDGEEPAISIGVVDRGMLPESTIAARHPIPEPSAVAAAGGPRRVRAALVALLRRAAEQGDTLLSTTEILDRLTTLNLAQPCDIGQDWFAAYQQQMKGVVDLFEVQINRKEGHIQALQLAELKRQEERLGKILESRARQPLAPIDVDWPTLLMSAITEAGGTFDPDNERHTRALREQAAALRQITARKLGVLIGRAGTGKTSVMGALLKCKPIADGGVLLLAPTGKARVRLGRAARTKAATIAQFLYALGRYDGKHQRPLFSDTKKYGLEKTVVIDEASMLTMDDLFAVLEALDLAYVQRVILVGDHNQLPPIGVGRPFADLVAHLERAAESENSQIQALGGALGKLTVEMRASAGTPSDTLRLASWFTREPQPADADSILSDLGAGARFNDLEVCFWKTSEDIHERLLEQFQKHLGLTGRGDIQGFNMALGMKNNWLSFDAPDGVENFQILSPVRMNPHGVYSLNRWVQRQFRKYELRAAREYTNGSPRKLSLGDEEIVLRDKVIQLSNERRSAYDGTGSSKVDLANGEIGIIAQEVNGTYGSFHNAVFAGRPGLRVMYQRKDFPQGSGPLELAYALTIHKAQGSEFGIVFIILPKQSSLLSRELLYTALTRSRNRLVLLLEGEEQEASQLLYAYTRPEQSETARRNTNLFQGALREQSNTVPYVEHLIHRAQKGHLVRSKSELVIANTLYQLGISYDYERQLDGENAPGRRWPDFSFTDPGGNLILWEHLGMLHQPGYKEGWEKKLAWYEQNDFFLNQNLFTTQEDERGGLDSTEVRKLAEHIQTLL